MREDLCEENCPVFLGVNASGCVYPGNLLLLRSGFSIKL